MDFIEGRVHNFMEEFSKLEMPDEKAECVQTFVTELYSLMGSASTRHADGFWLGATDAQLEDALHALERSLITRVYIAAVFPHAEGDYQRDKCAHSSPTPLTFPLPFSRSISPPLLSRLFFLIFFQSFCFPRTSLGFCHHASFLTGIIVPLKQFQI